MLKVRLYHPLFLALIYLIIHVLIRVSFSETLQVDDREQVLYGQYLSLGYSMPQPPLYSWLSWAFFKFFGTNLFALTVLKYSLIYATYVFTWLLASKLFPDGSTKNLVFYSFFLMPSFFWHMHQGFTHTIILGLSIMMTTFYLVALEENKQKSYYLYLGISIGIGLLSKYSFILFLLPILLASLISRDFRKIFLSKKFLITLLTVLFISGPHFFWLTNNYVEISQQASERLAIISNNLNFLTPLWELSFSAIGFITPLFLLLIPLIIKSIFTESRKKLPSPTYKIFLNFYLIILFFSLVLSIFYDIPKIKVRWLHPIMMLFPFWFFLKYSSQEYFAGFNKKIFYLSVIVISVLVLTIRVAQMTIGPELGYYSRVNFPVIETLKKIPTEISDNSLIVVEDYTLFAHVMILFKNNEIRYRNKTFNKSDKSSEKCLIISDTQKINPEIVQKKLETKIAEFKYQIYFQISEKNKCG